MKTLFIFQNLLNKSTPKFKYNYYLKLFSEVHGEKNIINTFTNKKIKSEIISRDFFGGNICRYCDYQASILLDYLKKNNKINTFISYERIRISISAILYYQELTIRYAEKYNKNLKNIIVLPFYNIANFKTTLGFDYDLYKILKKNKLINANVKYSKPFLLFSYISKKLYFLYLLFKIILMPEIAFFKLRKRSKNKLVKNFNICYDVDLSFTKDRWPYNIEYFFNISKNNDILLCRENNGPTSIEKIPISVKNKFGENIVCNAFKEVSILEYINKTYAKIFLLRIKYFFLSLFFFDNINEYYKNLGAELHINLLLTKFIFKKNINYMTRGSDYEIINMKQLNIQTLFLYISSTEIFLKNKKKDNFANINEMSDMHYDKIFCNKFSIDYFHHQGCQNSKIIEVGNFFSKIITDKSNSSEIKKFLNIDPQMKVVTVLDQKTNIKNILTLDQFKLFLEMIYELMNINNYIICFRSKNYYEPFENDLQIVRERVYKHKNFINLNEIKYSHHQILSISDFSIHCPVSSTIIEALTGLKKTIIYDPGSRRNDPHLIHNIIPNIYSTNMNELNKLINHWLNEVTDKEFNKFINKYVLGYLDSYMDNKSNERLNKFLNEN